MAFNCAPPSCRQCSLLRFFRSSALCLLSCFVNPVLNFCSHRAHIASRMMEPRRPGSKAQGVPATAAETKITTGSSSATSTTESQLVALLSDSRREAESLRRELAAVQKKAEADQRRLQALLESSSSRTESADLQIRRFQDRIARAEAALEEAEQRSRLIERNWQQVERYLGTIQQQTAASRTAFSRLLEQADGPLVLPDVPPPIFWERTPRQYTPAPRGADRSPYASTSRHHPRDSPPAQYSPREQHYVPPPLLTPRRADSSRLRSPTEIEGERWEGEIDDVPPYKRQRAARRATPPDMLFRPQSAASAMRPPRTHEYEYRYESDGDGDRSRHSSRDQMPPPSVPRHTRSRSRPHRADADPRPLPPPLPPGPYRQSEAVRAYDARNPPLQIIQHRNPPVLPHSPPPPSPAPAHQSAAVDAPHPFQHQHRFHLAPGGHGHAARRVVRPGAYETVVFALDGPGSGPGAPSSHPHPHLGQEREPRAAGR
ncbi:hypothetical protein B0H11DRAFT_919756 [Mycena galericulata]|nr:hypothetical protein B0H11DRAFT_919756 [Mycena galericulata]